MAHEANHCDVIGCPACRDVDRESERDERLRAEVAKLNAVMPAACLEYEADIDGVGAGWSETIDDGEIEVELTVTVTARGVTAREVLTELTATSIGTNLLAHYGMEGLFGMDDSMAAREAVA